MKPLSAPLLLRQRSAFSLVELSIVLVILGLLAGGILTGQSLIRAAELRNVTTEFSRFQTAVHTFRDKYFALPGDMKNATDFWGIAAGSGNDTTCKNTVQLTKATCNGNGNSQITNDYESFLTWKHLANAELIEGDFPGTYASNGGYTSPYTYATLIMPDWNVPNSRLSGGVWDVANRGSWNVSIQKFHNDYAAPPLYAIPYYVNSLYLYDRSLSPAVNGQGPLSPQEAWGIDKKIDDGEPASGNVEAFRGAGSTAAPGTCLTSGDPAVAEYDLDEDGNCVMVFVGAFR